MASKRKKQTPATGGVATIQKRNRLEEDKKFLTRLAGIFVILILGLHPLAITPRGYYEVTGTKLWFSGLIMAAFVLLGGMGCLLLVLTYPELKPKKGPRGLWKALHPYERAAAVLLLVLLLSTVFAENRQVAVLGATQRNEGFVVKSLYLLSALLLGRIYKPRERDMLIFVAVAAAVTAYGVCQYYGHDFLGLTVPNYPASGPQMVFVSTMSNRNIVSHYACMAFCVGLVIGCQGQGRWHLLFVPPTLVCFYYILHSNTESGYINLAVALPLAFPLICKDKRSAARFLWSMGACCMLVYAACRFHAGAFPDLIYQFAFLGKYMLPLAAVLVAAGMLVQFLPLPKLPVKQYRAAWYILLVLAVVAAVVMLPYLAEGQTEGPAHEAVQIMEGNFDDSYGTWRIFTWKRALALAKERPLLGYGPDNFALVFQQHYQEESLAITGTEFDKAHNYYIQALVDTGALGLLSVLAFFSLLLWQSRRVLGKPMALAAATAVMGFLVQDFFNIGTPFAHPVAWVLWGILAAEGQLTAANEQ